jgi:hypothetical protein
MAETAHTTILRAGARPVPGFSNVQTAHVDLLARLTLAKPNRIAYEADRRDLEERAVHIGAVLNATLDYVGAVVRDTAHVVPGGALSQSDQKYVLNLITDVASDVVGFIANAADNLGRD